MMRLFLGGWLMLLFTPSLCAQTQKFYWTSADESIISMANFSGSGTALNAIPRFSYFFNSQTFFHADVLPFAGLMTGISIRNVGFIYDANDTLRKKHRVYTLGIPLGIKLGKVHSHYFFGGIEWSLPFNYKEKSIIGQRKEKFNTWFSGRVPVLYTSLFGGINFSKSVMLKFQYYLTDFFDPEFTEEILVNGTPQTISPYRDFNAQLWYVALSFQFPIDGKAPDKATEEQNLTTNIW